MTQARCLPHGVLSRAAAKRILRPYQGLLAQSVVHAWGQWTAIGAGVPSARADMDRGVRAHMLNNFMCKEAARKFSGIPSVQVVEEHGQLVLTFASGDLRLAFHKINRFVSPPQSGRQAAIWAQDDATGSLHGQAPMPGVVSGTRVECGYILDRTETQVEEVVVRCSTNGRVDWVIELPLVARAAHHTGSVGTHPLVVSAAPQSRIASATGHREQRHASEL